MSAGNNGLQNHGNTCYLNSAIQCLSHIDILNNSNFKKQILKYKKNISPLINEWLDIQNKMWSPGYTDIINLKNLINIFKQKCISDGRFFESFAQNDASEFLNHFLEFLHDDISHSVTMTIQGEKKNTLDKLYYNNLKSLETHFKKSYSYIVEQFYSSLLSLTQCPSCNKTTDNHEPISIITLTIMREFNSFYDCIDEYVKKISLDDDNKFKCEKCNEYVNIDKKTHFWDLPPILIFLIKKYDVNGVFDNSIQYPMKLDMNNYCLNYKENTMDYELRGLIIHTGSLGGGHYTAICKNNIDNKWHKYDDANVSDIDEDNLFNINPYCLFYKRV